MQSPHFVNLDRVKEAIRGKSVCIVGSGPGCRENNIGFIDSHDVVIRVNNYKLFQRTGYRTDIHYSFYGGSIRKTVAELQSDGVYLCICKCPNEKIMESEWHVKNGKPNGVDFRWIYDYRRQYWFCDTYVPSLAHFMKKFDMLGGRTPTTGFSAILDVLECEPRSIYLTGFDFFASNTHNVDERWVRRSEDDPIGHDPDGELRWLDEHMKDYPIKTDKRLARHLNDLSL